MGGRLLLLCGPLHQLQGLDHRALAACRPVFEGGRSPAIANGGASTTMHTYVTLIRPHYEAFADAWHSLFGFGPFASSRLPAWATHRLLNHPPQLLLTNPPSQRGGGWPGNQLRRWKIIPDLHPGTLGMVTANQAVHQALVLRSLKYRTSAWWHQQRIFHYSDGDDQPPTLRAPGQFAADYNNLCGRDL